MKKFTWLLFILAIGITANAQTTLIAGDIAFVGSNTDGATNADDNFSFVLLKDITVDTEIIFTDRGWNEVGGFSNYLGDGEFTWVSSTNRSAGDIITLNFSALNPAAAAFSYIGDQLFAIQGSIANPTFIAGFNFNQEDGVSTDANWDGAATNNATSALPDGLVNGVNAVRLIDAAGLESDNWQFSCTLAASSPISGSAQEIAAIINNRDNWNESNITVFDPEVENGCSFVIDGCTEPVIYYLDLDKDGYGIDDPKTNISSCDNLGEGYSTFNGDCNDTNNTVYPNAPEICDGMDNNCDGNIDEGLLKTTYYADTDADGLGDPNVSEENCSQPEGYVANADDCDDNNAAIGAATIWYADMDTDGFGDLNTSVESCTQPQNYVANNTDCDDADHTVYPGATEIADDGIDQDCDGQDLISITGDQGCTPGFWKNTDNWCGTYQKSENFYVVFGITNTRNLGALTLVEALGKNGGGYAKLARQATAALLNACNLGVNYPYSVAQIITEVQEIFNNPALSKFNAENLGHLYDLANNLGCPNKNSNSTNKDKEISSADAGFNKVQAYPNPLQTDGVWIQFNRVERKEKYSAIIYDFNGRKLAEGSFEVDLQNTKHFWNIDHGTWGQGVFVLKLKSGSNEYQIRLIK